MTMRSGNNDGKIMDANIKRQNLFMFYFWYRFLSFLLYYFLPCLFFPENVSNAYLRAGLGIGIEKTNAGIGIPASPILVRYRTTKMPDCVSLVRHRTCSGIVSFFQSGTD
jgi:hypothetical protein